VAMARNGLDVVNSFVPFMRAHSEEFRAMWGGFPPVSAADDPISDREARLKDLLPGGMLDHIYFEYVKNWWPYRNEKNVLMLHYSDAIKDLDGTVTKLADFLDVKLSKNEHTNVVQKCGMKHMKANTHLFNYALPLNPEWRETSKQIMVSGSLTRKGGIGEGHNVFTDQQATRWAAGEVAELTDPGLLEWAREGGIFGVDS